MASAKALYPYDAADKAELTIKEGDIIKILHKGDDGWWEGELKGKKGLFPGNYVEEIPTSGSTPNRTFIKEEKQPAATGGQQVKVLYDFTDDDSSNLKLKAGDIITVTDKSDSDWWIGTIKGKTGAFPANYVQPLESDKAKSDKRMTMMPADEDDDDAEDGDEHAEHFAISPDDLMTSNMDDLEITQYHPVTEDRKWGDFGPHYKIIVRDPQKKSKYSGIKKYIAYEIVTEPNGFSVERRYKHFDWLRQQLVEKFPSVNIPTIPPKQSGGRFEKDFIEHRRAQLEQFLYRCALNPVLRNANVFEHFVSAGEKTWKQGKRASEKDKRRGAYFYKTLQPAATNLPIDTDDQVAHAKKHLRNFSKQLTLFHPVAQHMMDERVVYAHDVKKFGNALRGIVNMKGDYGQCWKPECKACLRLTEALSCVELTTAQICEISENQRYLDGHYITEAMKEYNSMSKTFEDVFSIYETSSSHNHSAQSKASKPSATPEDQVKADEVKGRYERVGHATLAELEHWHTQRLRDFKSNMRYYIEEQMAYHRKIADKWESMLMMVDQIPGSLIEKPRLSIPPPEKD